MDSHLGGPKATMEDVQHQSTPSKETLLRAFDLVSSPLCSPHGHESFSFFQTQPPDSFNCFHERERERERFFSHPTPQGSKQSACQVHSAPHLNKHHHSPHHNPRSQESTTRPPFLSLPSSYFIFFLALFSFLGTSPVSPINSSHAKPSRRRLRLKMLRTGSKRAGFSPDIYERPTISLTSNPHPRASRRRRKQAPAGFTSRLLKNARLSPGRFFRHVGANMVKALHFVSRKEPSAKASMDVAPQGFVPPRDSHHSEAIEDCIKFINSTSRRSC